jgi:hypothetical protein
MFCAVLVLYAVGWLLPQVTPWLLPHSFQFIVPVILPFDAEDSEPQRNQRHGAVLEKVIVPQLVSILWILFSLMTNYFVDNSPLHVPDPSYMNAFHTVPPCFLKIDLIVLHPRIGLPGGLFHCVFRMSPMRAQMARPSLHQQPNWWGVLTTKAAITRLCLFFYLLPPSPMSSTVFSNSVRCSSRSVRDQVNQHTENMTN